MINKNQKKGMWHTNSCFLHLGIKSRVSLAALLALSSSMYAETGKTDFSVSTVTTALQQSRKITGIVKDEFGEPLSSVSVVIKGTTTGTMTDLDGKFAIDVKPDDILEFSYIGFNKTSVAVDKKSTIDVILKENSQALQDVVVVGYGTQKKVNVTGSVSMVTADVIESRPVQNVSQALQGVIPGLNFSVNNSGGALDNALNVSIRGAGTIGDGSNGSPLVLIDGMEGNMNAINPNDIESVSVLKDAASASIYGSRAAFGVILITTKSGKSGKTNVSYSGNVRFTDALQIPEMMDSYQFAQYFNAAAANAGEGAVFSDDMMEKILQYKRGEINYGTTANSDGKWNNYTGSFANTDWFKEMYKDWVPSQEHNLSINGGSDKVTYLVSGSFLDQNGLIRHGKDKFSRYTLTAKINAQLAEWATMTYSNKWIREDYERPSYMTGLFFHNIARRWPTCPVYDPNGYLQEGMEVIQMKDGGIQTKQKDYNYQQLQFIFEPIKDWKIYAEGNMMILNQPEHWEVLPVYAHDENGEPYAISWDGGADFAPGYSRVNEYRYQENYYSSNIYTEYFKEFKGHYIKGMAGFNSELTKTNSITGQGDGLTSADVPFLSATTDNFRANGGKDHTAVAGFFARVNYNYQDKYMLEMNGRYDGTSRFIGDKRWGFFPSVSGGWNIARESFFSPLAESVSTLKLRASWGQLGNMNTKAWYPFFLSMPISAASGGWLVDGSKPNLAGVPGIVSSQMTWETVESWDIGLDWAAFNNRLTGSFDYFTRFTKDMIGPAPQLSAILGTNPPKINNADMKSYGFELEIGWRDRIGKVSYGIKGVLADCQDKITRYPNQTKSLTTWYPGQMKGDIWGYETIGIAQSQEEMDRHIASLPNGGQSSLGSNWAAGDIMYKDLNNDGTISSGKNTVDDSGDMKVIGNTTPRFNYGLTLDLSWNNFDFSVFFQGVGKRDYWLGGAYFWGASGGMWQSAGFKEHWDFWRPEGDPLGANLDAYYPRASFNGTKNQKVQSGYLQNAAYLRMKNIQVGYSLPKNIIAKAGMSNVRVYVSGDNLWTVSSITGVFDPETLGGDWGEGKLYPLCKTISVGLNVNF